MRPKVLEISYVPFPYILINKQATMLIIRWHETQAVYSCDFQPLPLAQLKRLLAEDDNSSSSASASTSTAGPIIAGGRQYRLATAGGDSKVRVRSCSPILCLVGADGSYG
jgi:chromatin assembly factor 1 subunit B